ncbi:PhzF family phenazine biosynthesis protein [Streptomyces sp. NPDC058657]|uniref:PhzF family phenazine biosynthesis protein n=1 Tax=unclassified Streptomyces TaxID=2593676 RepID=UPI0036517EC1
MHDYMIVDAFSRTPLEGNPVAVFFDADDLDAGTMQRIAKEMNLSESTFVLDPQDPGADARVRIFTPVNELPFAGHPMLGTAVALGLTRKQESLRLETAMGTLPFTLGYDDDAADAAHRGTGPAAHAGRPVAVRMRQPVPVREPYPRAGELCAALGVDTAAVPVEAYRNGPRHVLVGLESVAALSALRPDHRALAAFPDMAANCFAGSGAQWRTRMFSPAYGVVEDAATGSAAGPLALHLARHRLAPYGQEISIRQGVEMGRPSLMLATAEGEGERVDAVHVGGHGVTVAHGTLHV